MTARSQRDHQDFAEAHVARIVDRLRLERSLLCQCERDASGHNNTSDGHRAHRQLSKQHRCYRR